MTWLYKQTEETLWTVGFYTPDGKWEPESDHGSPDEATQRVRWLNGAQDDPAETEDRAVKRLLLLAEDELGMNAVNLFDLVRDVADKAASDTNNQGLTDQIRFLLNQLGEKGTEQHLRDLAAG